MNWFFLCELDSDYNWSKVDYDSQRGAWIVVRRCSLTEDLLCYGQFRFLEQCEMFYKCIKDLYKEETSSFDTLWVPNCGTIDFISKKAFRTKG